MAQLNINPTRMELNQLQKRLGIAMRGHKLLQEKQNSLIGQFSQMVEQARLKRRSVESLLESIKNQYTLLSIHGDEALIQQELLGSESEVELRISRQYVRGVSIPAIQLAKSIQHFKPQAVSVASTPVFVDAVLSSYQQFLPEFIELAFLEKQCQMIAEELKTTRRRVNALEVKTIPDLEQTITMIRNRIDDNERSQLARMTRIQ